MDSVEAPPLFAVGGNGIILVIPGERVGTLTEMGVADAYGQAIITGIEPFSSQAKMRVDSSASDTDENEGNATALVSIAPVLSEIDYRYDETKPLAFVAETSVLFAASGGKIVDGGSKIVGIAASQGPSTELTLRLEVRSEYVSASKASALFATSSIRLAWALPPTQLTTAEPADPIEDLDREGLLRHIMGAVMDPNPSVYRGASQARALLSPTWHVSPGAPGDATTQLYPSPKAVLITRRPYWVSNVLSSKYVLPPESQQSRRDLNAWTVLPRSGAECELRATYDGRRYILNVLGRLEAQLADAWDVNTMGSVPTEIHGFGTSTLGSEFSPDQGVWVSERIPDSAEFYSLPILKAAGLEDADVTAAGNALNAQWAAALQLQLVGETSNTTDQRGEVSFTDVGVVAAQGSVIALRTHCTFRASEVATMAAGTVIVGSTRQRWLPLEADIHAGSLPADGAVTEGVSGKHG